MPASEFIFYFTISSQRKRKTEEGKKKRNYLRRRGRKWKVKEKKIGNKIFSSSFLSLHFLFWSLWWSFMMIIIVIIFYDYDERTVHIFSSPSLSFFDAILMTFFCLLEFYLLERERENVPEPLGTISLYTFSLTLSLAFSRRISSSNL